MADGYQAQGSFDPTGYTPIVTCNAGVISSIQSQKKGTRLYLSLSMESGTQGYTFYNSPVYTLKDECCVRLMLYSKS